jgi:triacylglycerol lipase
MGQTLTQTNARVQSAPEESVLRNQRRVRKTRLAILKPLLSTITVSWLLSVPLVAFALSRPPFPVLFIHGLASNADDSWGLFSDFLLNNGWRFGGTPEFNPATGEVFGFNEAVNSSDFYAMNFSDHGLPLPSQSLTLEQQGIQVAAVIRGVLEANPGADKVILVGHSMGGLAARAYLQSLGVNRYAGNVSTLITVGTPHLGARFAELCQTSDLCLIIQVDRNSVAVGELRPDSAALFALNHPNNTTSTSLPGGIHYVSIIGTGKISILSGLDGDGIVDASSQDLSNVPGTSGLLLESDPIFIQDRSDCGILIETHTCETSDKAVWAKIIDEIALTPPPPAQGDISDFVERLYQQVLGRQADPAGLQAFVQQIETFGTVIPTVLAFFHSQEFLNRHTSNAEFLTTLYHTLLDRDPDPAGFIAFLNDLNSGLRTRGNLIDIFLDSQEFADLASFLPPLDSLIAFVTNLYVRILGRGPDLAGLQSFVAQLQQSRTVLPTVLILLHSPEFLARNTSNTEYVTVLYRVFLDRVPDAVGLAGWVALLTQGAATRDQLAAQFAASPEFQAIQHQLFP